MISSSRCATGRPPPEQRWHPELWEAPGGSGKSKLQDQDGSASGSLSLGPRQTLQAHPLRSLHRMDRIMGGKGANPPLSLTGPGAASAERKN